jgi:cytochrome c peroxidase
MRTNKDRAERAAKTLQYYAELDDVIVDQETLRDLLADLLHMFKAEGSDDAIDILYDNLAEAVDYYEDEIKGG